MWRSRTFWRLFGTYSVLWILVIALLGLILVSRVERYFLEQIEDSLRTRAILVRQVAEELMADRVALQSGMTRLHNEIATRITLLDADGNVLVDSDRDPRKMENHRDRPEVREADHRPFGTAVRISQTLGVSMMYVALRTDDAGPGVAYVRVALPLDQVEARLATLRGIVWTGALGAGLAGMLLAFWLTHGLVAPLQELTHGAGEIAAGKFGHKVYTSGRDEVTTLARAFNQMSARLAQQFAQLEDDREQLRTILSGMVEGVVALDAEQSILFANERAAQLLGFRNQEATGRKLWEVVRQRSLQEMVRRAIQSNEPASGEISWNGGPSRNLTVHAARLPGGAERGAVLVLHDTSDLRRLERLRQEFVANVSHELKTPLAVIKACVETLLDGAVNDPEHRGPFLERIAEQGERLHALILDLLSLARIESGVEVFEYKAISVETAVQECLERHRARADAKKQSLTAAGSSENGESRTPQAGGHDAGSPTALSVWADEEAIAQILDNLVDNAVKYTPEGGRIVVGWREAAGQVCIEVADSGIGIPERDLPRVFERFYRVDRARSRELGGTGLGLSIVKHLVQAMHGAVQASSREGQGTTFTVRLPRSPTA
jgi:two-component system phosphate regulon sensor histidine kinase PhoR